MRRTIKLGGGRAVTLAPDADGIGAALTYHGMPVGMMLFTPEQWVEMVSAGNQCLEQRAGCIEVVKAVRDINAGEVL